MTTNDDLMKWIERVREAGGYSALIVADGAVYRARFERVGPQSQPPVTGWVAPVGSEEYPTAAWYVAVVHDETGAKNDGYAHTGIDLNIARPPFGDIDRGQPVMAVTGGKIHGTGHHGTYLGGAVIEIEHDGKPLWVRYWHLANDDVFQSWHPGDTVAAGDVLGHIGAYKNGDHLHFDMRTEPFGVHWWFTNHPGGWVDPAPILASHLGPALVDMMASMEYG